MPYWPGRRPNVNDKHRGLGPFTVTSIADLERLPCAEDPVVERLRDNKAQDEEIANDNARVMQVVGLTQALGKMARRTDHRKRPRGVSRATNALFRKLKIRSPDRLKKRKK